MTPEPHPEHGIEELCDAGARLYEHALREGHIRTEDTAEAPCLTDLGLLDPAIDDLDRLEPVPPAVVLNQLLRGFRARIADERRREDRLVEMFEPLMRLDGRRPTATETPTLRLLSSTERINRAITEAMAEEEVLSIQPHISHISERIEIGRSVAFDRDQALLDRGGHIRTLYQHTLRHQPATYAYCQRLHGDNQARSLDELTDRLIVVDRTVAFIPADDDGRTALEVRHPALIKYFAKTFDRLWRLATPMYPDAVEPPSLNGVTPRQHAIASLLIEGRTDADIAERLGLNIRTARVHIAKLAATLGSESRAQLGYLIARSGILDQGPGAGG
ncbi:helix-turn-helix transcriptional regulator [Streptomyces sp. V3I7]|uniref:helix-turn-helix transcriptional regulator n=1 Tax=Streptomyces sp. V3I7 TaxID=3042278 RepID=UPI002783A420|nr:helix-turn-helix transcriptional regulator [Streptomyces sp. V3I7]MDQ0992044.1 DNA-binding CsgD family transcriptional regulator [Streptomyces sp. V3I7]